MKITDSFIEAQSALLWDKAKGEYGNAFDVPRDERDDIYEIERALFILKKWDGNSSPVKLFRDYMVRDRAVTYVLENYAPDFASEAPKADEIVKTEKRSDKYAKLDKYAKEHVFEQFTTEQLVEMSGLSYPTVVKYLKVTGSYRAIKRGLWEARDAKADREAGL